MTNTGAVPLLITGAQTTGDFSVVNSCGDFVAVGTSCQIQVSFLPTASGPRAATLLVYDNAPGSPHSVLLTNSDPPNPILVSPSTLDFSGQVIGVSPASRNVTLTNTGAQVLTIGGPSIANSAGSAFTIGGTTCSSTLLPGGSCSIAITFSPTATGVQTATLAVPGAATNGSFSTVSLTGTGWDFSLKLRDSSPMVSPNHSGSYDVDVMPQGGFVGTIALAVSCNVLGIASCTVTPSSIAVTDASPVTIHIQADTTASANLGTLLGVVAVLFLGLTFRFRSLSALVLALVFLAGCAGAVGDSSQNASSPQGITLLGASQGGTRTLSLPVSSP